MSEIVTEIDKYRKGWTGGLPETPCGRGSQFHKTEAQRRWIPEIIARYGITSIADIGAGDLNWIGRTDLLGASYAAYDLVPRDPSVKQFDLINEIPPKVDMIMCLWVLNHLPFAHCRRALENLRASGSKYLMVTDRLRYRKDQPPEIDMPYIEKLSINDRGDSIRLVNYG